MEKFVLKQDEIEVLSEKIANLDFATRRELHCIRIIDTSYKFFDFKGLILHEEFKNIERMDNSWVYVFNINVGNGNSIYEEIDLIDLGDGFYVCSKDGQIYKKVKEVDRVVLKECHKVVVENKRTILKQFQAESKDVCF